MQPVRRHAPEPRLEMTPLIDVVFLLLTFFVLSIVLMVRADAFDIDLPEAAGGGATRHPDTVDVVLTAEGDVRIEGELVDRPLVAQAILQRLGSRPDAVVRLAADENSRTGDFIRLQQELTQAGVERVSILTAGESPDRTPDEPPAQPAPNENGPG